MKKFTILVTAVAVLLLTTSSAYSVPRREIGRLTVKGPGYLKLLANEGSDVFTPRVRIYFSEKLQSLVSRRGNLLEGVGSIPPDTTDVRISRNGTVRYKVAGQSKLFSAGMISAFTFDHPEALTPIGDGYFQETEGSGFPLTGFLDEAGLGYVVFRKPR